MNKKRNHTRQQIVSTVFIMLLSACGGGGGGGGSSSTPGTVNNTPTGSVTINGTATQGQLLTASNTLADADGLGTISYQWKANGSNITGATGSTYTLTLAEVGKTITVVASYTDGHGTAESATSSATGAVTISYHLLAAGGASNCRIDGSTKALVCWGQNDMGQLGIGNLTNPNPAPTSVNLGAGKTAKQVAMGIDHACAILDDDSVSCWGNNSAGQLGQPLTTVSSASPLAVPGVFAKSLSLGLEHTCVITPANSVQCWGGNSKGQLGLPAGSLAQSYLPQATISGLTAKVILSGYNHVCAIANDDTVKCWGDNQYGQLGNATIVDSATPVGASGLSNVMQLSLGAYHSCAATASAIFCWGKNNAGQLGSNGTTSMNVPTQTDTARASVSQLAAGLSHTCALSGTAIECWGSNASMQLSGTTGGGTGFVAVPLTSNPVSMAAGLNHTCAQDSNNQTYCWGAGTSGRLGPNAATDAATPVLVP